MGVPQELKHKLALTAEVDMGKERGEAFGSVG